jgi:hypothetical protein
LEGGDYSPGLTKQMVWLGGLLPFEQAAQVLERIGCRVVPGSTLWDQSRQHGERMKAHLERRREHVSPERVILPPPGRDHGQPQGISLDGGMVNVRGEGWKEIKVGAVFEVEKQAEPDPITGEEVLQARGVNVEYAAVLGSPEAFGPALWALAVEREVPQAARTSVTADGAEWIWNLVADYFPDSEQIVDWYHACDHLHQAAGALHPENPEQAEAWFHGRRENLFLGEVQAITTPLDEAGLEDQSRYFHTHQRRMRYQEFREEGYPIGSGTVESGIKQFKLRVSGPGMRWSRPGAERMLAIRGAVMGKTFDRLWAAA